jgi:hypothetical protein
MIVDDGEAKKESKTQKAARERAEAEAKHAEAVEKAAKEGKPAPAPLPAPPTATIIADPTPEAPGLPEHQMRTEIANLNDPGTGKWTCAGETGELKAKVLAIR